MPTIQLSDRSLIRVAGPDAEHFLQNILTTDLDQLETGSLKPGALLTPQGKILFDFLIARDGADAFTLDCRASLGNDFLRRLMLYRLRAKAEISKQEQMPVAICWETDSASSQNDSTTSRTDSRWLKDVRFPPEAGVLRRYGAEPSGAGDADAWTRLRIAHGIAESGADYEPGDAFPHDVLLDQSGGVGFRKGCYVGQEVVSRMQHRGTARRRVMIASGDVRLPQSGTEIKANDRVIGALGSVAGSEGLAIVRIDRVKAALDAGQGITAGDAALALTIPAWASYTLPQTETGAEDT